MNFPKKSVKKSAKKELRCYVVQPVNLGTLFLAEEDLDQATLLRLGRRYLREELKHMDKPQYQVRLAKELPPGWNKYFLVWGPAEMVASEALKLNKR